MNKFNKRLLFLILKNASLVWVMYFCYSTIPEARHVIAYVLFVCMFFACVNIDLEEWNRETKEELRKAVMGLKNGR